MKKILIVLAVLMGFSLQVISQDKKPKEAPKNAVSKSSAVAPKSSVNAPTKKDGTPDMRYKENKEAVKPTGPVKKDGTPDMRYKENKAVPKKKGK